MAEKTFLIVGGSSGIGYEIVRQLLDEGHEVFVISRSKGNLDKEHRVRHLHADVTDPDLDLQGLPVQLDGVVYCPGSINLKQLRSLKPADFQSDFEVNVLGAVRVLKKTYPLLKKSDHASIVLFSTVAVGQGMPFHTSVAASKGAVEGMMRSLAAEWAPKIRVNCVAPSLVDTPLAQKLLSTPERKEASDKRHPLRRVGRPEDIASMAVYLLSEQSGWISGQVFGVDGGLSRLRV